MTTRVDFTPSPDVLFTFTMELLGIQYTATTPWNIAREDFYISVTNLNGDILLFSALIESGPAFSAQLSWDAPGVATAVCSGPHNVGLGQVALTRISGTGTGFDGVWLALAVDDVTLTYTLPVNPQVAPSVSGTASFDVDLLAGLGIGSLYYHSDTMQFEF